MQKWEYLRISFSDDKVSMMNGRMKPAIKEKAMQDFKKGDTKIMVATTVIEVGVDVPNASVMIIESAERYGLSQLHQLRGRVGRSHHPTSAPFVKMPPPSRAKIEISEPPNARPMRGCAISLIEAPGAAWPSRTQ